MERNSKNMTLKSQSEDTNQGSSQGPHPSHSEEIAGILNKMNIDENEVPVVEQLMLNTKPTTISAVKQKAAQLKKKTGTSSSSEGANRRPNFRHTKKSKDKVWYTNSSPTTKVQLVVYFHNHYLTFGDRDMDHFFFSSIMYVFPLNDSTDMNTIMEYNHGSTLRYHQKFEPDSFPKMNINGDYMIEYPYDDRDSAGGSDDDLYEPFDDGVVSFKIESRGLKNEVNVLGISGLTEDLLMKYIIALAEPKMYLFAEDSLRDQINEQMSCGSAQNQQDDNTWFNVWKYYLDK